MMLHVKLGKIVLLSTVKFDRVYTEEVTITIVK